MAETQNLMLFRKWDLDGIEIKDPGLKTAISLRKMITPYTYGRSALKRFNKADVNIVERLANKLSCSIFIWCRVLYCSNQNLNWILSGL